MTIDMGGFVPPYFTQYDYVQVTSNLTITATSTASANTFITGNPVAFDGSTRIIVECWVGLGQITSTHFLFLNLWDNSTDLGYFTNLSSSSGTLTTGPLYGKRFLTPSNGVHTYTIRASKSAGTATLYANTGIVDTTAPAWYRITKA